MINNGATVFSLKRNFIFFIFSVALSNPYQKLQKYFYIIIKFNYKNILYKNYQKFYFLKHNLIILSKFHIKLFTIVVINLQKFIEIIKYF